MVARAAPSLIGAKPFARTRALLPRGGLLPNEVWATRHRAIVTLLWLHAVVIAAIVLLRGYGVTHTLLEGGVVAAAAVAASYGGVERRLRALAATFGLLSSSAILVHLSGGYIEMHFHFFVMIIVISLYQDWWPFLLAVGYVVFHHGVIGVLDPASVYNHPDAVAHPWVWAGIHGGFILAASVASMAAWRLNEDLIRDRVAAEHHARALAEASVKTREDFLAIATHELRTPVTSVKGYAQLALRSLDGPGGIDSERLRRTLDALDGQTDRLARLVSQLLDVSQLEAGRLALDLSEVDLGALILTQVELAKHRATDKHRWNVAVPLGHRATVDAGRIEQVVANLLDNAIRYSPSGGTVDLALSVSDDSAQLDVTDEGIGIAPDRLPRIFDRFYQAHADRNYGGMGLGLYICKQIVDRHGGTISVRSGTGRGSVFSVRLPLTARRSPAAPAPRVVSQDEGLTAATRATAGPIMIVEDDDAIREVVADALRDAGYEVIACRNGHDALARLRTAAPSLIIVDKLMPDMGGSDFAKAYRELPGDHTPLVGLCAARDGAEWAAQIGAIGFIPKPFGIADLVRGIDRFVGMAAAVADR